MISHKNTQKIVCSIYHKLNIINVTMMQNCEVVSNSIFLVEIYAMEHLCAQVTKLYN